MSVLVIIAIVISQWYYKDINNSIDPRVAPARELYKNYNRYAELNNFDSILILMDSIESIYSAIPHYRNGFEVGVLYNNRAASWLTIALYSEIRDSLERDSLIHLAESAIATSLDMYASWSRIYSDLEKDEVDSLLQFDFLKGLERYSEDDQKKYLGNRVQEIIETQSEIDRRISVSYTNRGIVYRYHEQYDSAVNSYIKALELWDRNLTAENNLNILLGQPVKKRNVIQRMFPPDRL
jgi:tetratricopeptide (TPR) repeat protein